VAASDLDGQLDRGFDVQGRPLLPGSIGRFESEGVPRRRELFGEAGLGTR
jgi:hypothetical protein